MVLSAESVTVVVGDVMVGTQMVGSGLGGLKYGHRLGFGPRINLIGPYHCYNGSIPNKKSYGDCSSWVRCLSKPLRLILMSDFPSISFDPFIFFFFPPHLGEGYIYKVTPVLPTASHLYLLKAWEKTVCYLSITCWGGSEAFQGDVICLIMGPPHKCLGNTQDQQAQ